MNATRTPTSKGAGTSGGASTIQLALVLGFVALVAAAYGALRAGHALTGTGASIPGNPFQALIEVATGKLVWPTVSTVLLVLGALAVLALAFLAGYLRRQRRGPSASIDARAKLMASPSQLTGVTGKQARDKARRLRPELAEVTDRNLEARDIGVVVGRTVVGRKDVFMSWEDVLLAVAGPRMGKTAALAINALCSAPGPALFTSNKRDGHDLTRGVREQVGRAWRYDLQNIADSDRAAGDGFWWNPLHGIDRIVTARKLASYFAAAGRESGSKVDSYFDGGAQELLAQMILAAAAGGGDLLHVYGWLSEEDNELPQRILEEHGHLVVAKRLRATAGLNQRQRDGLYDMARRFIGLLEERTYAMSVVPPVRAELTRPGLRDTDIGRVQYPHAMPEFVIDDFVAGTDTLYALSKEGPDSSAALTTALIGSIVDAAQRRARGSRGGRLPVPMLVVLDEAANVCRLPELPAWYSHLGSQGICMMTVIQNLAQAQNVWGPEGVKQLLDAANFLWYGGGIKERNTLADLSALVGDHDVERWTTSRSGGGLGGGSSSKSQSWSREPILPVDDLAALPNTRALVQISANHPVLVEKLYCNEGPYKDRIADSNARYGIPGVLPVALGGDEDGAVDHSDDDEPKEPFL